MIDLAQFQQLWVDLDPALKEYKDEVRSLRASVDSPGDSDSQEVTHERLKSARRAQDRTEQILADVGLIRSRVRKLVAELQDNYDDAWAEAMNRTRIGEYTSAKERDATYSLASIQQLINLRKAKNMLIDVEEVYDFIQLKYRGLDAVRNDIKSSLRIGEFEAHYER